MARLIDKDRILAEIEKQQRRLCILGQSNEVELRKNVAIQNGVYCSLLSFLDTLEVEESKLLNPRFPHLNSIVDKVFGTANLEPFEHEEAEQLVLLAKEELLKDLAVKVVDLEKEIDLVEDKYHGFESLSRADIIEIIKHFFEFGIKAQKG